MALTRPVIIPPWAETGDKSAQPSDSDIQEGWPLTSTPPSRQKFNWLLNFLANGVRYLTARGVADWDSGETYAIGSVCIGDDNKLYKSLQASNSNKQPSTQAAWWALVTPENATTTKSGIVEQATQAEMNAGTADKWPDAATIFNGFVQSGTTNGYIKLPEWLGGLIIQWGEGSTDPADNTEPTQSISFSIPFTTVFQAYASTSVSAANDNCDMWYQTYNLSTSGFNIKRQVSAAATNTTTTKPTWWAIGK